MNSFQVGGLPGRGIAGIVSPSPGVFFVADPEGYADVRCRDHGAVYVAVLWLWPTETWRSVGVGGLWHRQCNGESLPHLAGLHGQRDGSQLCRPQWQYVDSKCSDAYKAHQWFAKPLAGISTSLQFALFVLHYTAVCKTCSAECFLLL